MRRLGVVVAALEGKGERLALGAYDFQGTLLYELKVIDPIAKEFELQFMVTCDTRFTIVWRYQRIEN